MIEHVVQDFQTVKVVFVDGSTYTADVIGTDPVGDIAVLQIVGDLTQELQPLKTLNGEFNYD